MEDKHLRKWVIWDDSATPHHAPVPIPERTPFPAAPPVPRARKHFKCNIANMWRNYVVQHRNINTATSQNYVVQHRKTCPATSKNMYCNIENYVLQHQKLRIATFQIVVLQQCKINHETRKWKHSKIICSNNPKIPLQHSEIICCNIAKTHCNTEK